MISQEILVQLRSNFNSLFYELMTLVGTKIIEITFVYIYFSDNLKEKVSSKSKFYVSSGTNLLINNISYIF